MPSSLHRGNCQGCSVFCEHSVSIGDKFIHVWPKPKCENIGDDLGDVVDLDNGSKVGFIPRPFLLRLEENIHEIEPMEIGHMKVSEVHDHSDDILL